MTATPRNPALSSFDPLLVELVRADAPQRSLLAEGFTHFEVSAVKALVKRDGSSITRPVGEATSTYGSVTAGST